MGWKVMPWGTTGVRGPQSETQSTYPWLPAAVVAAGQPVGTVSVIDPPSKSTLAENWSMKV
jgi:hypothetical protein